LTEETIEMGDSVNSWLTA